MHVTPGRRFPRALVGGVDGEFPGLGGSPHVRVGEREFAHSPSRVKPLTPWLAQTCFTPGRGKPSAAAARLATGAQDAEDGADGDVDVHVAGAIQRVGEVTGRPGDMAVLR